jgi:hypothetical protein
LKKKKTPGSLKNKKVDRPLPRTCQTCEFDAKDMCIIHGEGYKGREANTCNDWGISSRAFTKQEKRQKR